MPMVVVSRRGEWGGLLRTMKVELGSESIGVRANSTVRHDVAVGPLEIRAAMDWVRSPSVHVDLGEDDELHLRTNLSSNPVDMFVTTSRGIRLEVDRAATLRAGTSAEVVDRARVSAEPFRGRNLVPLALAVLAALVGCVLVVVVAALLFPT